MSRITYQRHKRLRRQRLIVIAVVCVLAIFIATAISLVIILAGGKSGGEETPTRPMLKSETLEGIGIDSFIKEDDAYIAAHYPHTDNKEVNAALKQYTDEAIAAFREKLLSKQDEFYQDFKVFRFDKNIVSFKFHQYDYHQSDANGIDTVHTATFNLADGKRYGIDSLFKSEDYLKSLSQLVYDGLRKQDVYKSSQEASLLKEGTAPKEENFENFVLDGDSLTILFKPYQVGSRTNPTSEYQIPLSELNGLLSDSFRTQAAMPDATPAPADPPNPPVSSAPDETLKGKKLVALTFDDGPHKTLTPKLLDILKKEDVKATFFVLGSRVEYYPDVAKRAAEEGHQVASHTMNHKDLTKLSAEGRKAEINRTVKCITDTTGIAPTAMRPPYGALNDAVKKAAGAAVILWSVDPEDWRTRDTDVVYKKVMDKVKDGDIILLHDIHETSVSAAAKIIPALKAEGYTFVTVEQLIRIRDGESQNGKVYSELRPPKPPEAAAESESESDSE